MMEEYSEKPSAPSKVPFYKKKKYWIICSILTVITTITVVLLAIFVFFPMIAQNIMNAAKIDVDAAQISFSKPEALNSQTYSKRDGDNMNTTFYMNMESSLSKTGPFSANIRYHNPIEVLYKDQVLGNIFLFNDSSISHGKGTLNAITPFLIKDEAAFASFSRDMMAVESFEWTLRGKLDITALTRTATINLDKKITLNGMNGFPNVHIESFQLPGDDPNGGIFVELGTVLESPSPIGVQLGTIALSIGYDGVNIGTVQAENVNLAKGDNHILLKGTLIPQTDSNALEKVGNLFSNYVSGKVSNTSAVGISAAPDGVNPISWLSEGFKSVQLNVALAAAEPLKIINSVQMGYLDLNFDDANPYKPSANAPSVNADFKIPFGFSLNITEVTQNITLAVNTSDTETTDFATIHVPNVAAISDQKAGTLKFPLKNDAIAGIPERESFFDQYIYSLTASNNYTFMVSGNASTKTNTPIGPITLGGISFSVPTTLRGLQFLNSSATVINSLDVSGGTTQNLLLDINVTMINPSDFGISTGDVSFVMGADGTDLGLVTLSNLTLARGENTVAATATFDPKSSDVGKNLLSTFVMGSDNSVSISGYSNSTNISSLVGSLGALNLVSTLPGLKAALIQGGAMTVLPDTVTSGTVGVKVSIANPFSSGLSITKVTAAATLSGMPVGNIDQDISNNPFVIPGKVTAESQDLDMNLNVEPASIALLLRTLAVKADMDTRSLDALLGLGGFEIAGMEAVGSDSSLFANFNISNYVMEAMKALKVDLSLTSGLSIGQYQQDLSFSQGSVAIKTDSSVTSLIPIVGQPIVQQIVDGAVLGFESIVMSAPTETGFSVQMKGSITKCGPIDAIISFPSPLSVSWQGKKLGTVTMAAISSKADVGANFDVAGKFVISNGDDMASFAAYMINNKDFVWDIATKDVSVNALGFTFTKISMEKFVALAGAQGFKDSVTIKSFDLPSNDPAGGITLTAETSIKNPSQIGFNFAGVSFETIFKDTDLGPLASNGAAVFPPQGAASISMKGRLVPQNSASGLAAINEVFNNYLGGNSSIVQVKGVSASGPGGVVGWLSTAFKTLLIENVILPGPKVKPQLIPAVTLKDMSLDFTKDPWAPPASSSNVQAQIKSPFGFPLGVNELSMKVEATYKGSGVATLDVPTEKATTSSTGLVSTQFTDVPFKVIDKTLFSGFVQLLTLSPSVTFGLEGATNAVAQTAVGEISLKNIGFSVDTSLAGFADFGGKATILSIKISGGTSDYILIDLTFSLDNPSNITITIGDINFDTILNEFNSVIGSVYLKDVVIPPGSKVFSAQMHLGERVTNSKGVSQVLSDYLTAATVPVTIVGSERSTTIAPLSPALSSVKLASSMSGIQANLISGIAVKGSLIGLIFQKKATSQITLQNPMDTSYAIKSVKASVVFKPTSGAEPFTVGTIDYNLPSPAVVPAKGSMKTEDWPVTIEGSGPEHLIQLLGMLFDKEKYFDVQQNVTVIVGGAYESEMFYYQDRVPFTLSIDNLPPIGIEPSSISAQSLPKNLTSITDPDEFQNMLSKFLSGKPLFDVSSSSSNPSSSTVPSTSNISASPTQTSSSTTKEEKDLTTTTTEPSKTTVKEPTTTSEEKSDVTTSSEAKAAATTSERPWFKLPF
ncbi:uncharacterized protein EV154DRAFT_447271 [Mucor mucedo]|uniref:uncharacterized protein n=1 Tax=Mucor mucedo TaxID=29922 RepID=UPI00221F7A7B|nr:uncharacterized protein EV154DRAFT_447271 [Mucor mucedo]KAI7888807.1 hypothetical protein EV154DRAFT_447271 [Mucor mucedo]